MLATFASLMLHDRVIADSDLLPVSVARNGFPAELSYELRKGFSWETAYDTGNRNLYYFLHWEEYVPHNVVGRAGPLAEFAVGTDARLGLVLARSSLGKMTLEELLADSRSRVQGFLVVHKGRIVFEKYPGMRPVDRHMWFSVSKTITGLLVGMLEAEGKIHVDHTIDHYLPELGATNWAGIPIIDILDMATGLDLVESEDARNTPSTSVNHFFRLEIGDDVGIETLTSDQVVFSVARKGEPGTVFEYSSLDTRMLGLLIERVTGERMADLISDRIWSRMGAEGDAIVAVNPEGRAGMYGLFSSRLRDMARYGMLYTPSWRRVASERVVPAKLLQKIRGECRPPIYERGMAARGIDAQSADRPRCNSRHWDAVFDDGDMYKGGARGQGLYVSPARDLVVAWFSTTREDGWQNYGRALAKAIEP